MKKILNLVLIGLVCFALVGCGNKDNDTNKKEQGGNSAKDISKQYEKIRKDFVAIKSNITVENIEKVTGIKRTTIKDGVEEYGSISYEYKFDYGYDYEAYIKLRYSHNPKSIYKYDTIYVELKCPDELFRNSKLDLSGLTKTEFKAAFDRGIKVSGVNNLAGGEGFASGYETSYKTGEAYITHLVWADTKGNIIKSSLRGGETVALQDKTLSYVSYQLKQ